MTEKKQSQLMWVSMLSAVTFLLSNIAAIKIWNLLGFPVDGGIIVFPIIYVLGDLAAELFGEKRAINIILFSTAITAISLLVLVIVETLPVYPGWNDQAAFATILSSTTRVAFASIAAYVVSGIINSIVFDRMKRQQKNENAGFIARALSSSVVARIFDTVIFEIIAFAGVLPTEDFVKQILFAYAAGMILETALSPITAIIVKIMKRADCPKDSPDTQ